jgi:hypothetical protein
MLKKLTEIILILILLIPISIRSNITTSTILFVGKVPRSRVRPARFLLLSTQFLFGFEGLSFFLLTPKSSQTKSNVNEI